MTTTDLTPDRTADDTPDHAHHPRPPATRRALRLDHTRELLGLVPYQLGFEPRDSVVAVSLRGPRREVGLVARVDVADLLCPAGAGIAAGVAGHLASDGATEVVVVVYDDAGDPREPGRGMRCDGTARAVRAAQVTRAACARVGDVAVWLVTQGHYLGLDCRDRGCCPPGGRPLEDLAAGELAGHLVGRLVGRRDPVLPSRDDVGAIAPAAAGPRRSASAARSRWTDLLLRSTRPVDVLAWRQRSLGTWRAALAAVQDRRSEGDPATTDVGPDVGADVGAVAAAALGRIEAALDDPAVRDAVVLTLVQPGTDVPDALVRYADDGIAGRRGAWDGDPAGDDGYPDEAEVPGSPLEEAGDDALAGPDAEAGWAAGRPRSPGDPAGPDGERCARAAADGGPRTPTVGARAVSDAVRAALDVLVEPACAREPDQDVAEAAQALLERVVAHGRSERQAPALTLLALLAWWEGDGVRASVLVERALSHDPGHRLAEVLDRALGAGLPPGWMRRRC
ncbi:DUF4192 family protein [Cellulomonas hominis]|uniref:DUF4192 family protein n=1 Tax=Cellulomonas hominis TaxID=156981 RepID=UPI001B8E8E35|nr:DUF4192 family protein [Cellulomonas hominis]VTR78266.1 hypothetical protein CHMI_03042 [Cellulomonas hominis]